VSGEADNATTFNHLGNRQFRRKKRFQGADWTPPSMSAETGDGEWCRACRQRHGYKTMGLAYEKASSGRWKILWSCRKTGAVIKEQEL
jgi:hypothetical protein